MHNVYVIYVELVVIFSKKRLLFERTFLSFAHIIDNKFVL